ncbi:hypothetical protein ACFQW6_10925 [Nocardioides sp. GCM10028917]|uniref:hypothetical protein n=1 Tax=Nocardioides sp. GCM10028917 TaxID=3273408 RepID=UPI003621725D
MSDQLTSQSRSNESGITRRTALRGAAWSASAVTVVVAVPAYAAASDATGFSGPTFTRKGQDVTATTSFTLVRKSVVTAVMTYKINQPNGTVVSSGSIASPWVGTWDHSTGSATFARPVTAASGVVTFAPTLALSNTSYTSITFSITFTWDGGSKVVGGTYVK